MSEWLGDNTFRTLGGEVHRVEVGHRTVDDVRNALSVPVPHPDVPNDWLRIALSDNRAQARWLRDPHVSRWLTECRLDLVRGLFAQLPDEPDEREKAVASVGRALEASATKLTTLMDG